MSCEIGNAQSRATFFRHSAVPSLPAVLLGKLPSLNIDDGNTKENVTWKYAFVQLRLFCVFAILFALCNFGEVHLDWIAGSTVLLVEPIKFLICDVAVTVPIVICCQDSLRSMC